MRKEVMLPILDTVTIYYMFCNINYPENSLSSTLLGGGVQYNLSSQAIFKKTVFASITKGNKSKSHSYTTEGLRQR